MSLQALPAGACDTHIHVYDHRYAAAPSSLLRPPDASVDDYREVQRALGLQRVVVVQPSTYGFDNRCQVEAIAGLGLDAARAVVVVDERVTDVDLAELTMAGARGARFHMLPGGALAWSALPVVAEKIAPFGWHVQLQLNGRQLSEHVEALLALPTPLVVDHVGRFMPPVSPDDERFGALLRLVSAGRCWVKLSAPYESALDDTHSYVAVTHLVDALIRHAPERMLWATNWPHPGQAQPPGLDDLRRLLFEWMPDASLRQRILVDNPIELYGFGSSGPINAPPTEEHP